MQSSYGRSGLFCCTLLAGLIWPIAARAADPPEYPLVIRLDQSALADLSPGKVTDTRKIDSVVMGTHAVGEGVTTGTIAVQLVPDRNDASFNVIFQGQTQTKTVGVHRPAVIYCHTNTDFVCTMPITFYAREGFSAGACSVVAQSHIGYDGFDSLRGRLGRRLISRVASRRASCLRPQAECVTARMHERELREGFEKQVAPRLAAMNQKLDLVGYITVFMGEVPVQLATSSSSECIHFGFGAHTSDARLTVVPRSHDSGSPLEIFVHRSLLGEPVAKIVELLEDTVLPQAVRMQLLTALRFNDERAAQIRDIAIYDDWLVLVLQGGAKPEVKK